MKTTLAVLASFLGACSVGGTYSGQLVDGMSGQPRGGEGMQVIAEADAATDLTCQTRAAEVAADGTFSLSGICSGTNYKLKVNDDTLYIADLGVIDGGATLEGQELKVYRAPSGTGVYVLTGDKLQPVRTFSDVTRETLKNDMMVVYPDMKPTGKVTTIAGDDMLVIAGGALGEKLQFKPLVLADGEVKLLRPDDTFSVITDHPFVGVKFTNPKTGDFEMVEATVDDSKVMTVALRDDQVRYMRADALPEGRYALLGDNDQRLFVVDFGASQAPAKQTADAG